MAELDWKAIEVEATHLLQQLIRLDTTNPPGNEALAAEYVADVLSREGIEAQVLEGYPGRGNVVAELAGSTDAPPLVLLSHLDVVPAEAEEWEHPPFSGALCGGYVWGRGAVDTKNLTAIEMMVMMLLKRQGVDLRRGVKLVATAAEETGGREGIAWLVKEHPERVFGQYAINEGGGFALRLGGVDFYTCQVAEKGACRVKLTARGSPGHASIPRPDNSVIKLARAVDKLGRGKAPVHLTTTVRSFLEAIAARQPPVIAQPIERFLSEPATGLDISALPLEEHMALMLEAMLRNTFTPTILSAGTKINVIPSQAICRVDGRVLPGQSQEQALKELRRLVGEEVEMEMEEFWAGTEASSETPFFQAIKEAMAHHEPQAMVLPYMVTGGTDARILSKLGVKVYGFAAARPDPAGSLLELAHAHNERISQENLLFGTQVLYDLVKDFCAGG